MVKELQLLTASSCPEVCVCAHAYVCTCVCAYTHVPICVYICVPLHVCIYVPLCVCMPACICIAYVCTPVCVCMCAHTCACTCMYACVPIHVKPVCVHAHKCLSACVSVCTCVEWQGGEFSVQTQGGGHSSPCCSPESRETLGANFFLRIPSHYAEVPLVLESRQHGGYQEPRACLSP